MYCSDTHSQPSPVPWWNEQNAMREHMVDPEMMIWYLELQRGFLVLKE